MKVKVYVWSELGSRECCLTYILCMVGRHGTSLVVQYHMETMCVRQLNGIGFTKFKRLMGLNVHQDGSRMSERGSLFEIKANISLIVQLKEKISKERKKNDFNVVIGVNFGVASSFSWSKCICHSEMGSTRIRGAPMTHTYLWRWAPWLGMDNRPTPICHNGKPLGSHKVGWKLLVHLETPTMNGWTIGGRVHCKSIARKVTHPGTIPALGGLISEFLWSLGLSHPIRLDTNSYYILK